MAETRDEQQVYRAAERAVGLVGVPVLDRTSASQLAARKSHTLEPRSRVTGIAAEDTLGPTLSYAGTNR